MNDVIAKTEGVTQAFLIELVYRAVQIASESQPVDSKDLALSNENFLEALEEMKRSADRSGETILGFHT